MHHRDFFTALQRELTNRLYEPLSIIDLGCGDAVSIATLLRRCDVERYVGIDLSDTALARAQVNLSAVGAPFELHCAGMLEQLRRLKGDFNLAIAGYSLHHLQRPEKQELLNECRRLLRPGGVLAVIDVFLEEGESSQAYLGRWEENAKQNFTALTPGELEELLIHVRSSDHPETVADYTRLGEVAGFKRLIAIYQDAERLNRLVILF